MIITLWNYFRGYVTIEVTGFSVERFINMAVRRGIYVWDVTYSEKGVIMNVSVKAFKMLRECSRKTQCKVKIAEKKGFPFLAHRYRKRKLLAAGFVFFVLALYVLASFIWLVEVTGNERLAGRDIADFCSEFGLKPGSVRYGLDVKEIEKQLITRFDDIAWVNIHIRGTRAEIQIKETIPRQIIVDRSTPCDIVAAKDGLVVGVATSAGTPMVKEYDVVHKGDVLVKGELVVKRDEAVVMQEYVHADAKVLARLYYDINFSVPLSYTEKEYTGRTEKRPALLAFNRLLELPFNRAPFASFDRTTERKQLSLGKDYPLPVIIVTTTYREFKPVQKQRTPDEAKEMAERIVTSRIIREMDFDADIMEKNIDFVENSDELLVKSVVVTLEEIGEERIVVDFGEDNG